MDERQIYSDDFKKWFGDWEVKARLLKLKDSEDAVISGNEIAVTDDLRQNRKNALSYGKSLRASYTNKDTGEVISLTAGNRRGGIRELLQHDFLDKEHLQSIAAIPQIIENSVFIQSEENADRDNYPDVRMFNHYLCGLRIKDDDYTVRAVVAIQSNGERYYDHKLTNIEKGKIVNLAFKRPASSELSSPEEQGDAELIRPANGVRESNQSPLSECKDKHLVSILQTDCSKIVDEKGRPLVVEHGTHADFTVFDAGRIGSNSKDNGLFGAGFYFGTTAPGWLNDGKEDYRIKRVFLDIRRPFGIEDKVSLDIYSEIKTKLDSPALRTLTLKGFNGKEMTVGDYIGHIKAVDELMSGSPDAKEKMMAQDEELQSYHPKVRERIFREHEILRRTGMGMSWQTLIAEQIGSRRFTEAAIKDGYDGVIVDRGGGYMEYVAFGSSQIRKAAEDLMVNRPLQVQENTPSHRLTPEEREAGGALVDHLEKMGVKVHTDSRENRRVLRDAEKDKSEAEKVRHMRTEDGRDYGFSYKGEMYLDLAKVNAELPLHEYAHLWCEAMRRINPENWNSVVGIMKQDAQTWDYVRKTYPDIKNEGDIAEECIARYSGRKGAERLHAELRRMTVKDDNYGSRWGNIFQNIGKAVQDFWKHVGDSLNISYKDKDEIADMIMKDFATGISPVAKVRRWLEERDRQYCDAVALAVKTGGEKGWDKAHGLFMDALREHAGNGIVPMMAVDGYRGKLDRLARAVKEENNKDAVREAADLMARHLPSNAVLIPAPSHTGCATYTLRLANALAERCEVPVADILRCRPHESQYMTKKTTGHAMTSDEMGVYKAGELPEGRTPFIIDNVVNTGNTAQACVRALGTGIVYSLSSAVSPQTHVSSLRSAMTAVYDKDGGLIPLSKRFDIRDRWIGCAADYVFADDRLQVKGLERYSQKEIQKMVREHFERVLEGTDIDARIVDMKIIGSRVNGNSGSDSDLDVLLEFKGDAREDSLFNILNDDEKEDGRLYIEGIPVDINPITEGKSGTIREFLERNSSYRKEDDISINNIKDMNHMEDNRQQEKAKDTVIYDGGENVTVTAQGGDTAEYVKLHGWTHDDPALIYNNTDIDVFFYDSGRNTVENIDNEGGIDAYQDSKGFFLVRASEYDEAYARLSVWLSLADILPENGDKIILNEPFSITEADGLKKGLSVEVKEVRRAMSPEHDDDVFICGNEHGGINTSRLWYRDLDKLNDILFNNEYKAEVAMDYGGRSLTKRSDTVSSEEADLISRYVMDQVTGNHLLDRKRPESYSEIRQELTEAHERVMGMHPLTDRQRNLLITESLMYLGGVSELAEELNVDEDYLSSLLTADVKTGQKDDREADLQETSAFDYDGRSYPVREIELPHAGEDALIATTELEKALMKDDGSYKDDAARAVDEQILYYVSPQEIRLPDNELALLVEREALDLFGGQKENKAVIDALRINPVDYIKNDDLNETANIIKNFENPKFLNEKTDDQQDTMTIEQVQEKAVKLFGNNFVFDFWNEAEPGNKIDQIDLGGMPDSITIDKLVIKDGKLSLYSNDLADDIDLQALDAVDISKVDASLGDIKEYLGSGQTETKSQGNVLGKDGEEPYRITYGTFPGLSDIYGDIHVDLRKNMDAVSFKEIQKMAREHGGEASVMNGSEWADFHTKDAALRFAKAVTTLNSERLANDERIKDVCIFSLREGGWAIRCRIDGRQMLSKKLSAEDSRNLSDRTDRKTLAAKYFARELENGREKKNSIKR